MPLGECIRTHSHREYLTLLAWLDLEWDRPSREDWYTMQLTAEVASMFRKPRRPGEFKMRFSSEDRPRMTRQEAADMAKAVWRARIRASLEQQREGR